MSGDWKCFCYCRLGGKRNFSPEVTVATGMPGVVFATALLLLVPAVAMQFTTEASWGPGRLHPRRNPSFWRRRGHRHDAQAREEYGSGYSPHLRLCCRSRLPARRLRTDSNPGSDHRGELASDSSVGRDRSLPTRKERSTLPQSAPARRLCADERTVGVSKPASVLIERLACTRSVTHSFEGLPATRSPGSAPSSPAFRSPC